MKPEELAEQLQGIEPENNDDEFNSEKNIIEHEKLYTDILSAYTESLKITLKRKLFYKKCVFWLSYALLCIFPAGFICLVFKYDFKSLVEWCSLIIPVLISFLTVFIVIPHVITQYLFNAEEEKYMSDVIKHIQDYDSSHN